MDGRTRLELRRLIAPLPATPSGDTEEQKEEGGGQESRMKMEKERGKGERRRMKFDEARGKKFEARERIEKFHRDIRGNLKSCAG